MKMKSEWLRIGTMVGMCECEGVHTHVLFKDVFMSQCPRHNLRVAQSAESRAFPTLRARVWTPARPSETHSLVYPEEALLQASSRALKGDFQRIDDWKGGRIQHSKLFYSVLFQQLFFFSLRTVDTLCSQQSCHVTWLLCGFDGSGPVRLLVFHKAATVTTCTLQVIQD